MSILFFLRKFPVIGGVEKITITLANALQKYGYKIIIVSELGKDFELYDELNKNIICKSLPENSFFSKRNLQFVNEIINDYNVKYFINQGCYVESNNFISKLKLRIPIISVLHNDPQAPIKDIERIVSQNDIKSIIKRTFLPLYKKWVYYLVKKDYNRLSKISSKVVLLSNSYIKSFVALSNAKEDQIEVIPNCLNFSDENIIPTKEKILLYVGRVVEQQKRLSRLFNIWKEINDNEWKLLILGDGQDLKTYQNLVKENDIHNIEFCGFIKDVRSYLRRASIISLVSDFEGFPMTIIEAMHEKCIPISYGSYSAIYDIIDNTNGVIVSPFNQKQYIRELKEIMYDQQKRMILSENAYRKSLKYNVDIIISSWINILK